MSEPPDSWFPGIDSPNFTMQPNVLYDDVMPRVSPPEWKVVCLIVRQTAGWHAETADISVDGIVTGTGLSRSTVFRALGELTRQGILISQKNIDERGGTLPTTYGLRYRRGGANVTPQARQPETPQSASVTPPFPLEERNRIKENDPDQVEEPAATLWHAALEQLRGRGVLASNLDTLAALPISLDGATLVVRAPAEIEASWGGYVRLALGERVVRFIR